MFSIECDRTLKTIQYKKSSHLNHYLPKLQFIALLDVFLKGKAHVYEEFYLFQMVACIVFFFIFDEILHFKGFHDKDQR